jgi:hypothetical protein
MHVIRVINQCWWSLLWYRKLDPLQICHCRIWFSYNRVSQTVPSSLVACKGYFPFLAPISRWQDRAPNHLPLNDSGWPVMSCSLPKPSTRPFITINILNHLASILKMEAACYSEKLTDLYSQKAAQRKAVYHTLKSLCVRLYFGVSLKLIMFISKRTQLYRRRGKTCRVSGWFTTGRQ